MTNKNRLPKVLIWMLFAGVMHSQTNIIKIKKDSLVINFTLAKLTTGFTTVDELIKDPIIRLEANTPLSIKSCELTLGVNGKAYAFRSNNCSALTAEQIKIIKSAETKYVNRIFIDAIALDEGKKELRLKTIALTIVSKIDPE